MAEYLFCVLIVALVAAFLLGLLNKWGVLEWLQVHAPSDFLNRLFSCRFCCSWWMSVLICGIWLAVMGRWEMAFVPVCSTVIAKELW